MSQRTILRELKKDALIALLQLSNIFWESIVPLFLLSVILLSHKILQKHLTNSIIIHSAVDLFHLLLILRVLITYLKKIYKQFKDFNNVAHKRKRGILKKEHRKVTKKISSQKKLSIRINK